MEGPDAWDRLWTPHRMVYIDGSDRPSGKSDEGGGECPFCRSPGDPEPESLVVACGGAVYAVLNKYPYNPGHLMICPYRHVANYVDLEPHELDEFTCFTRRAIGVITDVSHPGGFNIGMNQGIAGGAGIAEHLHQHIVPRWIGDTNFMPVTGGTKVLPQLLIQTRDLLRAAWDEG